jgi:8-oxo-dGTP pyrophosphatase MutT (NUDIX family)
MDVRKQAIGSCPHGLRIFLVDGESVRTEHDSDFVQGGNPERYKWIPPGEIWIDNTTPKPEVPFVALHECNEANLMATKGESYDQAHDESKELENKFRHHATRVAIVTCYNGQGQLLVGKRNDNQLYTLPAGHLEDGESPEQGAARELFEETGLRAMSLSHLKNYTLTDGTELHCFSAYVSGEPHSQNDPDDEVSEWEWIDVEEGLPPKVYNHLHGPQDEQNLIKQLFQLQKAEWEELFKRAKVWHSDDWGTARVSIPSMEHPDRPRYDANYTAALKDHYGPFIKPVKVATDQLIPQNEVHDKSRYNLYRKMYRAGEKLPPLVVRKSKTPGAYEILDGNHKYHAVKAEGGGKLDAYELNDGLSKAEQRLVKALKFMAAFRHPVSGKIVKTGSFHDVDQLPEGKLGSYQDGFVDEGDNFYTRAEAAHALKTTHPSYKPTKLDSGDLEGNWQTTGHVYRGLSKAEDEVFRMLDNPDPVERAMALKLDTVRPEHLFAAALDPDPSVYQPAIDDPRFGPSQSLSLMESVVGKNGAYPDAQKRLFLTRNGRVEPYHFTALLRAARMAGPAQLAQTVAQIAAHPQAPAGILRSMYLDPDVIHDSRMAIVSHPTATPDLLDHALKTALAVPGGGAADLGARAVEHLELPIGSLRALVDRAADRGEPHVTALAERALEYNQGLSTPALAEIFRDLLPKARLLPTSAAPALLAALLRNKSTSPALADEATRLMPPDALLRAGVMANPAFGPQHLQKMLDSLVSPTAPEIVHHHVVMHQLGFEPANHRAFKAAQFLANGVEGPSEEQVRSVLYFEDGDIDRAALAAYSLPCTEENLKALHAIMALTKSDPIMEPTPHAEKVVTAHLEGEDVAQMIERAFKTNYVFPVALGGKHSKGSIVAYDDQTHTTILLKSGSGGAGGAAGSKEDPSNPNAREAAFYHIAKQWGIGDYYPRAELVIIDDKMYSALQLLALDFKTLDEKERQDPGCARRILHPYLYSGTLHKWAVIDYILGNPDSHGQNVMVNSKDEVQLIDHGSAFAGPSFDPGHDNNSFVPYYLRAWCLDENFTKIDTETKLKSLPRVPGAVADELKRWFGDIVPENVRLVCTRYGINTEPTMDRLQKVSVRLGNEPLDLVINSLWVTT